MISLWEYKSIKSNTKLMSKMSRFYSIKCSNPIQFDKLTVVFFICTNHHACFLGKTGIL